MGKGAEQRGSTQVILTALSEETEIGFAKAKCNQCFMNLYAVVQPNYVNWAQQDDLGI
jgi:hypothetical protein